MRKSPIWQSFSNRSRQTTPHKYFPETDSHSSCGVINQSQSLQDNDVSMERWTTPAPASVWHGMKPSHPIWSGVWSATRQSAGPLRLGYGTSGADAGDCTAATPSSAWPRWTQSDGNSFYPNAGCSCPPLACFPALPCDCRPWLLSLLKSGSWSQRTRSGGRVHSHARQSCTPLCVVSPSFLPDRTNRLIC